MTKRIVCVANCTSLAPRDLSYPPEQREFDRNLSSPSRGRRDFLARHWEALNNKNAARAPIPTIVHQIVPAQSAAHRLTSGDFVHEQLPYLVRDIRLLAGLVQWFAGKSGNVFLERTMANGESRAEHFVNAFRAKTQWVDIVSLVLMFSCRTSEVLSRDRVIAEGLMRWLGSHQGRGFLTAYTAYKNVARRRRSPRRVPSKKTPPPMRQRREYQNRHFK